MSRPVGMSKVRMMEPSDAVTSHLESGEKVCRGGLDQSCFPNIIEAGNIYQVQNTASMTPELSDHLLRLDIDQANYAILAYNRKQTTVALQGH